MPLQPANLPLSCLSLAKAADSGRTHSPAISSAWCRSLSTLLNGEYGAKDLCMGVPCVVGGEGFIKTIELPLTEKESKIMAEKVASLDATYQALEVRS